MFNLLQKTIPELKKLLKESTKKSSKDISLILKSIDDSTPKKVLKKLEKENILYLFLPNKIKCEDFSYIELKKFLNKNFFNTQPAIDIIIHLYLLELQSKGAPDVLKWAVPTTVTVILEDRDYTKDEIEWLLEQINNLTDEKLMLKVSEVAEKHRVLPEGTPFPGPYLCERTPYLTEPMDSLSEQSPVEYEIWLKGHQLGYTLAVENGILYIIKHAPGPILYTTANDKIAVEWSETRFDQMIEQSGIQNMIFSQTKKKKNKKTGDKTLLKEFPGGWIKIAGYGSTAAFRMSSYLYYFGDEADEAVKDLKQQGNTLDKAKGRTSANKAKRKIFIWGTPIEKDLSNVYPAYLLGDQRKYYVPCPYCGFKQELIFKKLLYDRDKDGVLDVESVRYPCQGPKCDKVFYNYHKAEMYSSGDCEWRPTAKAKRPNYISRQMSCMYSPPGMITWTDMVQEYLDAIDSGDPGKMKIFQTEWLGWPYQETGEAPSFQQVIAHRSNYTSKTVPDGVLFLTLGADVHGNNIQIEIIGHGRKFKTWSIEYIQIDGDTENVSDPKSAWASFRQKFLSGSFVYQNKKGKFAPQMAFIDSNYRTDTVVEFCETIPGLFPITSQDKFAHQHQKFRINYLAGSNLMSVRIATDYYKDMIYSSLRTAKDPGAETPPNYPSFPYNYPDSFFKGINAEYKRGKKKGNVTIYEYYCPHGKPNHPLDCRVYGTSARDILYHFTIESMEEVIAQFEQRQRRKILASEKIEWFYSHMEKIGVIKT